MMFRSALFAMLAACVAAKKIPVAQEIPDFNIPTDSASGKRLLSKARRLEQNNNNQQQNAEEADWLSGYSIKYDSCASLIQVREEGGNEEEGLLYTQNLVKFVICPGNSGSCNDCGRGIAQYVVKIREYCYCDNANDEEYCENQCYTDAGMSVCIEVEGQEEMDINAMLECEAMEGANGQNNNNGGNYNY